MPMFRVEAEFHHPRIPTEIVELGDNQVQVSGIEKVERACRHYDAKNPDEASAKARVDLEKYHRSKDENDRKTLLQEGRETLGPVLNLPPESIFVQQAQELLRKWPGVIDVKITNGQNPDPGS